MTADKALGCDPRCVVLSVGNKHLSNEIGIDLSLLEIVLEQRGTEKDPIASEH